jgi:uncharacterized membrane protein YphA (DoxX/SURF4 family)
MDFLLTLHGEIRWLVALIAVVAMVRFAIGWLRGAEYKGLDRGLMAAYTGFLDLNFLLGLILLFGLGGGFPAYRIEHAVTMFIAVGVAHSAAAWRKSDDAALKFRNNLIVVVVSLLVVILGVIRLRGGWLW